MRLNVSKRTTLTEFRQCTLLHVNFRRRCFFSYSVQVFSGLMLDFFFFSRCGCALNSRSNKSNVFLEICESCYLGCSLSCSFPFGATGTQKWILVFMFLRHLPLGTATIIRPSLFYYSATTTVRDYVCFHDTGRFSYGKMDMRS